MPTLRFFLPALSSALLCLYACAPSTAGDSIDSPAARATPIERSSAPSTAGDSVDSPATRATPVERSSALASSTDDGASAPTAQVVLELPAPQRPLSVRVEVVRTREERERGLMFREHLDADAGMLFLFEQPQQLTFWMRNTYIPLDMIFLSSEWRIVGIVENATPRTDTPRSVPGLSQYVLEVNAGFAKKYGLASGSRARFIDAPFSPPKRGP